MKRFNSFMTKVPKICIFRFNLLEPILKVKSTWRTTHLNNRENILFILSLLNIVHFFYKNS